MPCHRVIASNLFIGGFLGEWGKEGPKSKHTGTPVDSAVGGRDEAEDFMCDRKLDLLAAEGVPFDDKGVLKSRDYLWDGKSI